MIEVVFSDSEKGAMKLAQNYNSNNMINSAVSIGFIGDKPSKFEREKLFEGKAMGGNIQDIVCIGFMLDIGDITGEIDGIGRKNVFENIWGRFGFDQEEKNRFFKSQREDIDKLLSAAESGTPMRIWRSNSPYSTCGFYYACNLLKDFDCRLSVVSLPKFIENDENKIEQTSSWAEIRPGKLYQFLPLEKIISDSEKMMYSNDWDIMVSENSSLRAMINARLLSVAEDFYDKFIIDKLPDEDFNFGKLIADVLTQYRLGIGDGFIASRIDEMVKNRKLIVVSDKDKSHPYQKILRKS